MLVKVDGAEMAVVVDVERSDGADANIGCDIAGGVVVCVSLWPNSEESPDACAPMGDRWSELSTPASEVTFP